MTGRSGAVSKADQWGGRLGEIRSFVGELYGHDLHAQRVEAVAGATLGVMAAASLAVAMIGQALAQARLGEQARDQTGGPVAEQQRHRRVGQLRPLGAAPGGGAAGHPGGDGLDRFRP